MSETPADDVALICLFCDKPIAEADCHSDENGESAHKDCAIAEFLAQAREERERTAPFIKMCAELVHPERAPGAHYTDAVRAQLAFAILDNIKRQANALQSAAKAEAP